MKKKSKSRIPPFREHASEAIGRLRGCFQAIIEALPEPVTRPSELQRSLDIDKVLGWRIYNLVQCPDVFAAARFVPGESGMNIFIRAAKRRGVPSSLTSPAQDAAADYRQLARVHARDRRSLEMMLAAQSTEGRADADVAHRRDAFRANSYTWGVRAQVQVRTAITNLSESQNTLDCVGIRGFVGLERIRPNQSWPIGTAFCVDEAGAEYKDISYEPLYDVENPDEKAAELFLSDPRPDIRCTRSPGRLRQELLPGPVGKTAAITCITGEVARNVISLEVSETNVSADHAAYVHTPCELLIFDQIIHEDVFGRMTPQLNVFAPLEMNAAYMSGRIPVLETIHYAGKASVALRTPEIPRYNDMLHFMFDRVGWNPLKFDVYRVRMQYPILPSYVQMRHLLQPAK